MKYLVLVPDGMADEPIEKLGGKTPLEYANTTNMDFLAQNGLCAQVQTIPEGMSPGSDVGNLALLGYAPEKVLTGRSPLEAANLGIILDDDEIAFRCNLVTITDGKMIDYSAGHISTEQAGILINALAEELNMEGVKLYPGTGYRHILVIKSHDIAKYQKLNCVAPHDIPGEDIKHFIPKGDGAKELLAIMEKAKNIFSNHTVNNVRVDLGENPANQVWLWGQGTRPQLDSFKKKYGVSGSIISAVDLVNGIGRLAGLNIINVPGATGYFDTDYSAKAEYALESLKENDFVYVHVEAPDEAGHLGSIEEKVRAIENFDKKIVGAVLNHFDRYDDVRILVVPDHPTPIAKKVHTNDPVPFVMYGKGIEDINELDVYGETSAAELGVKFRSGEEMMKFFIHKNF